MVTVTVPENDDAQGVFLFPDVSNRDVPELPNANNPFSLVVRRAAGAFESVVVSWVIERCTSSSCSSTNPAVDVSRDIGPASGTLTFTEGTTEQAIGLTVLDDQQMEGDQRYLVRLSSVSGTARLASQNTSLVVRIPANDDRVNFNVSSVTIEEGAGPLHLTLVRQGGGLANVTLQLQLLSKFTGRKKGSGVEMERDDVAWTRRTRSSSWVDERKEKKKKVNLLLSGLEMRRS